MFRSSTRVPKPASSTPPDHTLERLRRTRGRRTGACRRRRRWRRDVATPRGCVRRRAQHQPRRGRLSSGTTSCVDCHDPLRPNLYSRHRARSSTVGSRCLRCDDTNTAAELSNTYGTRSRRSRIRVQPEVPLRILRTRGGRNIASEVNAQNASVHAVEGAFASDANASTFETGWDATSVVYCVDCHDSADNRVGAVRGSHVSTAAPILARPYLGALPGDANLLCYKCHKRTVYFTGVPIPAPRASSTTAP